MELSLQAIIEQDLKVSLDDLQLYPQLVRQIQHCLTYYGLFDKAQINGEWDVYTRDMLRRFCHDVWLDTFSRGQIGPGLAKKLFEYKTEKDEKPVYFVPSSQVGKRELAHRDYVVAAKQYSVEIAALKAVVEVESAGRAFDKDGKPVILFEAHWFSYYTKGKYDGQYPRISSAKWNRSLYKVGKAEWDRFYQAAGLDNKAALLSTSWGLGQVMGFNYKNVGYRTVEEYVSATSFSASNQLDIMLRFIAGQGLIEALQKKDWAKFAYVYNGEGYKANDYDGKLSRAYVKHREA